MGQQSISAITGNGVIANIVHFAVLIVVCGMLASIIYSYEPLYHTLISENRWEGVIYLAVVSILISAYWPSLIYRLIITLMLPFSGLIKNREFILIDKAKLPPVSIVIAIRNEPASVVIPLLRSLVNLKYHDYELVIADNSDIILDDGRLNKEFLKIFKYASCNSIRFCRRDCGHPVSENVKSKYFGLASYMGKGDVGGGKAANLNLAISSSDDRFKWFIILDSDSILPEPTIHHLLTVGVSGATNNRSVGFVQSTLLSKNQHVSSVSHALSLIDEMYYREYFKVKASLGVVSNYGHGVLVSRVAWQSTKGFPLEISEDLAWANELALTGKFVNYYAESHTLEDKPKDWRALKVQRDRWAKGTTLLLKKQFWSIWKADNLHFSEKMDLSYDMMSYSFNAVGCLIPVLFLGSSVLGPNGVMVFKTLIPIFYFSLLIDNILLPLYSLRIALNGNIKKSWNIIKSIPKVSIYMGGISSQVFVSVAKALTTKHFIFHVTPKFNIDMPKCYLSIVKDNKMCYLLFMINGWVAISAWDFYPPLVPLLAISPLCYFFAPMIGTRVTKLEGGFF